MQKFDFHASISHNNKTEKCYISLEFTLEKGCHSTVHLKAENEFVYYIFLSYVNLLVIGFFWENGKWTTVESACSGTCNSEENDLIWYPWTVIVVNIVKETDDETDEEKT